MGAGAGREAARALWPLVLQLWEQHPLFFMIVAGVVALGVAFFLSWLWEIVRPPMPRPHDVYRPPVPDAAVRPEENETRHGAGR